MKTAKAILLSLIMILGMVQPASADRYGRDRDRYHQHERRFDHHRHHRDHGHRHHRHHRHHNRSDWGDVAAAAIIMGTVATIAYGAMSEPEPVIQAPPPPPQPQNRYWYYCASSRQYYPYVSFCPEGWQQVLP